MARSERLFSAWVEQMFHAFQPGQGLLEVVAGILGHR